MAAPKPPPRLKRRALQRRKKIADCLRATMKCLRRPYETGKSMLPRAAVRFVKRVSDDARLLGGTEREDSVERREVVAATPDHARTPLFAPSTLHLRLRGALHARNRSGRKIVRPGPAPRLHRSGPIARLPRLSQSRPRASRRSGA